MQSYIKRYIENKLREYFEIFPVVALLGPRQCGKSTLAKHIIGENADFIYLDLERPSDLRKLDDPELFFQSNSNKKICIDEIQLRPDLFRVLRGIIDEKRVNGRILILGSASKDLLKQSAETLAGRIGYLELSPFMQAELLKNSYELNLHWLKGGFPDSYLQKSIKKSAIWRKNFIKTYIERDIPQLGLNIPALTSRRFLTLCAHNQGQILNSSKLGASLGVSYHTIQNYVDFLEQTFILRVLPSFEPNFKKRVIKSPKVYIRDTGILHSLLDIEDFNHLLGHPVFGFSWEGFAIENILSVLSDWEAFFYRTSSGNEIDLILKKGSRMVAVEFKATTSPSLSKGFYMAIDELEIKESYVIAIVDEPYPIKNNVIITNLEHFILKMSSESTS